MRFQTILALLIIIGCEQPEDNLAHSDDAVLQALHGHWRADTVYTPITSGPCFLYQDWYIIDTNFADDDRTEAIISLIYDDCIACASSAATLDGESVKVSEGGYDWVFKMIDENLLEATFKNSEAEYVKILSKVSDSARAYCF